MAVNGVSQSSDVLLQQSANTARESRTAETAPPVPPRPEREPAAEPVRAEAPKAPQPVVNTSGQTTGTRVNTTA